MCVRVQPLTATRVLSGLGPEHLKPPSYPPLTYRGALPGLLESCCIVLGQRTTPTAKSERLVEYWVAIDDVAIAHDLGHGDNRKSSLGPLYRCNVDYEA